MPPGSLTTQERRVWEYICQQLRAAGIEHTTFGLAAAIVSRKYMDWVQVRVELEKFKRVNGGSHMVTTPNGFEQPHQLFYMAERIERSLLQYLPECCLTIPSATATKAKTGGLGDLDQLLLDLNEHGTAPRSGYGSG